MKISDWLLNHYKKKFGYDLVVLQHNSGSTWNDGGEWNDTIVKCGGEVLRIYMPSDYQCDNLQVTKMKAVMAEIYVNL
jgi:hypothetical protein